MVKAGSLTHVNIRGPFGYPVGPPERSEAAANMVAVGSGTGIVPMISLLKTRVRALRQLSIEGLERRRTTLAKRQTDGLLS
jgi:NAD(P)H-flavin reductase